MLVHSHTRPVHKENLKGYFDLQQDAELIKKVNEYVVDVKVFDDHVPSARNLKVRTATLVCSSVCHLPFLFLC